MKKQLTWVVIALIALIGLLMGCGPDPLAGITTETIRISRGTAEIDGVRDDAYGDEVQIAKVNWDKNPDVATASGTATALWDDDNLYIYVVVTDSTWDDPLRGTPYDRATIEVYVDENYSHGENYDQDDAQYRFNMDLQVTGWGSYDPEAKCAFVKTDDGYIVEAALPFQFELPMGNMLVGLDFQVNDSKGNGFREAVVCWNQDDDSAWSRSAKFGTGLLLDD